MKSTFIPLVLLSLAAGCGDVVAGRDRQSSLDGPPTAIAYSETYGFCLSGCARELTVSSLGEATVVERDRPGEPPRVERSFTLSAEETAHLFGLAEASLAEPWEPQYGCPDCSDQGRIDLALSDGSTVQETVLETIEHPRHLDALVGELAALTRREL